MHHLDRPLASHEQEFTFESDEVALDPELFGEAQDEVYGEVYGELSEEEELDLAHELLALENEEELDQFLGKLFKRIGRGLGKVLRPLGQVLKPIAKVALPIAGKVAGGFFGGPVGAALGGKLGTVASRLFEVDFETMEPGEAEVDAARRFVRLANAAAQQAASTPAAANPVAAARAAVASAARTHAPGLLKGALAPRPPAGGAPSHAARPCSCSACRGGKGQAGGRWVRRPQGLLLLGV